jgi:hypothetical protein
MPIWETAERTQAFQRDAGDEQCEPWYGYFAAMSDEVTTKVHTVQLSYFLLFAKY